jgi:hypothetical protein
MPLVPDRPDAIEREQLPSSAFGLRGDRKYLIDTPEAAVLTKARADAHLVDGLLNKRRRNHIISGANIVIWGSEAGQPALYATPDHSLLATVSASDAICAVNSFLFANAARETVSTFEKEAYQAHHDEAVAALLYNHGNVNSIKIMRAVSRAMLGFKSGVAARKAAVAVCLGKRVSVLAI